MEMLSVPELIADPAIGEATHLDQDRVARYAEILDHLPPIEVFQTPEGLILADGYHRVAAAHRAGASVIAAEIHHGSRHDVLRFAVAKGARQHGLSESEVRTRLMERHRKTPPDRAQPPL